MSYEPDPAYSKVVRVTRVNGRTYKRDLRGIWWREYEDDRPDVLIGRNRWLSEHLDKLAKQEEEQ